jgi:uncharacterized sulfatase
MGRSTDALIEFVDLYPTLADYAGLEAPHRLSGTSLRPILEDPAHPGKPAAFSQVNRGGVVGRSVRTPRYRYTEWGPAGRDGVELYDHDHDAGEYHNRADQPETADLRASLADLLERGFTHR